MLRSYIPLACVFSLAAFVGSLSITTTTEGSVSSDMIEDLYIRACGPRLAQIFSYACRHRGVIRPGSAPSAIIRIGGMSEDPWFIFSLFVLSSLYLFFSLTD